jgi:hypothetical protein
LAFEVYRHSHGDDQPCKCGFAAKVRELTLRDTGISDERAEGGKAGKIAVDETGKRGKERGRRKEGERENRTETACSF